MQKQDPFANFIHKDKQTVCGLLNGGHMNVWAYSGLEGNWGMLDMVWFCRSIALLSYPELPWKHQPHCTGTYFAASWFAQYMLVLLTYPTSLEI
jgi:hypothetical protein